jgi:methyl-accepting chemotaxis protein
MFDYVPNYLMDTNAEGSNIYETSFVANPATGQNFLKFNKSEVKTLEFKAVDGYQRMVSGVWFMPDTKYIRYDEEGRKYTIEIDKFVLRDALLKYLKADYANLIKVEHQGEYMDGFISIEHWIYQGEYTVSPVFGLSIYDLGYNPQDIAIGTVLKTIYVADENFWNTQILTGIVKGFSIGGLFSLQPENFSNKTYFEDETSTETVVEPIENVIETVVETSTEVVEPIENVIETVIETSTEVVEPIENVVETVIETSTEVETPTENVVELSKQIQELYSKFAKIDEVLASKDKEISLLSAENVSLKEQTVNANKTIENLTYCKTKY